MSKALMTAIVAGGMLAGCATTSTSFQPQASAVIAARDYEAVWNTTIEVLERYFDVAYENRYDGRIETAPVIGATILEPWRLDSVGFGQRLESTFQTIRRRGFVLIQPAPGGGFNLIVEVYKELEDLPRPIGSRLAGGTFFQSIQPLREEVVRGPVTPGLGWISLGRDKALEDQIIGELQARLNVTDDPASQIRFE